MADKLMHILNPDTMNSAYINNEINSEIKSRNLYYSLAIVKLTTSSFAPKYYFIFISLVGFTLFLQ